MPNKGEFGATKGAFIIIIGFWGVVIVKKKKGP